MNQDTLYQNVKKVLAVSPTTATDPSLQAMINGLNSLGGVCVTELVQKLEVGGKQQVVFGLICDEMGTELLRVVYRDIINTLGREINRAGVAFILHPHNVRLMHRPSVLSQSTGLVVYDSINLEFSSLDTLSFNMMFAAVMTACTDAVRRWHQIDAVNKQINSF